MADRYFVELAPAYVRLRHQLGIRSRLGGGWRPFPRWQEEWLAAMEAQEDAGERIVLHRDPDYEGDDPYEAYLEWQAEQEAQVEEEIYLSTLPPEEVEEYLDRQALARARKAAEERAGRGGKGMSPRSRREMWRWVLSLPFEMLGERPLWITLTYPGDWGRWVPDGRTFERHRRAFGEAWFRTFGERPLGFWSKEFQLANGRPHLHLLMKGPERMSDDDYQGFQALTRLAKSNERRMGKRQGRWWTPPISEKYGGPTAVELLSQWSHITTKGAVANHGRRGVNVRAVFYSPDASVERGMRRSAIAAYMAGEAAKFGQKVPPMGFGTVGRYFGAFGERSGFRPVVQLLEIEGDVWMELNRRLTLLDALRKRAKGRPLSEDAKRRRPWQGLTVGGLGPEEYGRLYARAYEAAARKRRPVVVSGIEAASGSLSVQEGGGSFQHSIVEGVEVAAHGGGGVLVPENLLDVEQVEAVPPGIGGSAVEDPGSAAAKVVGREVA